MPKPTSSLLERKQLLVRAFDFLFGLQEFLAPRFARALGALVDRIANCVTVIAGSFGTGARKLLAGFARLEELAFQRSVLIPEFVLANDAHKSS
jgi:hypothetical protein